MSILPTQNEFRFIMNAKGWMTRIMLRGAICMLVLCCSCGESDQEQKEYSYEGTDGQSND
jgi:hypothetical protein